jgi:hypothetical protein
MERVVATISADGVPVVEGVEAWVEVIAPPGGPKDWRGFFISTVGYPKLDPSVLYRLTTADGRSGDIVLNSTVPLGDHTPTRIDFLGSGRFG